ncbi:alpha/beta fold hydrolase [Pleomorphomonas sp. PLEO]|uniref:alpha/beta fold hydrolase n=1 Tax=Pleomorphomonas sp. PLEO TaxID=3239306 RepID=UPI00351F1E54
MLRRFLGAICLLLVVAMPAQALPKWQQFPAPPPMPRADQTGFADVRGISMFYSVYGKGKGSPILLIHGGMSSSDVWSFEVPTLAQSHEVIVADSRGQGRSTRGLAWLTYHRMAEDYVALLAQLKIDRVTLVGWSDGGIIGIDIAMYHPKLLDRLFAQAPNVTPGGLTSIPDIDPPPLSDNLSLSGAFEADPEIEKARNRQVARERVFRRLWATEPNYSDDDLAKIHVPTAIVIGDHDPVIRPDHIAHIAHIIPGAKLVVLKDVGHPAHSQDPKQYLKAILDFMGEPSATVTGAPAPKTSQPLAAVAQSQMKVAPKASQPPAAVAQSQTTIAPKASQPPAAVAQSQTKVAPKASQPPAAVAQSQTKVAPKATQPSAAVAQSQTTIAPKAPQPAAAVAQSQTTIAPKAPQPPAAVAQSQMKVAPKASQPAAALAQPQMTVAPKASQPAAAVAQSQTTVAPKAPQPPAAVAQSQMKVAPKTPQAAAAVAQSQTTVAPKASQPAAAVAQSQVTATPKPHAVLLLPPTAVVSQAHSVATSQTVGLSTQGTVQ